MLIEKIFDYDTFMYLAIIFVCVFVALNIIAEKLQKHAQGYSHDIRELYEWSIVSLCLCLVCLIAYFAFKFYESPPFHIPMSGTIL